MNKTEKLQFLLPELLQSTFRSAMPTRNEDYPIYNYENMDFNIARKMKNEIRQFLMDYYIQIKQKNKISEKSHIKKIIDLSNIISSKYKDILFKKRLRIGISQKLINLWLKYLWVINLIPEPYHCPIDSIVRYKLERNNKNIDFRDWTEMDNITDYLSYISEIKKISKLVELTVAKWELKYWKRRY